MNAHRVFACLCVASCATLPCAANAQQPAAPNGNDKVARAVDTKTYACADPTDASARRRVQDKPCKLPMYELPVTRDPSFAESPGAIDGHRDALLQRGAA